MSTSKLSSVNSNLSILGNEVIESDEFSPMLFCCMVAQEDLDEPMDGMEPELKCSRASLSMIAPIEFPELSKRCKREGKRMLYAYPPEIELIQVACGREHIIFVFSNRTVYVLGQNLQGQIGIGYDIESIEGTNAKKNTFFDPEKKLGCVSASCGAYHSIFMCQNNEFYGCGSNELGQLNCHVKSVEEYFDPNLCLYVPTRLLFGGLGSHLRSLGENATIEYQSYQTKVCGSNLAGNIGPKSRTIIEDMKILIDNGILIEDNSNRCLKLTMRRSNLIHVASSSTQTWFSVERDENDSTVLDIGKIENGEMHYLFTIPDPSQVVGIHCTHTFPMIHYFDKKANSYGLIIPTELANTLAFKGMATIKRTVPTTKYAKLSFVPFHSFIKTKSLITKVETSPFNNKVAFFEANGTSMWILNSSFKLKKVDAATFLQGYNYDLTIHSAFTEDKMVVYLNKQ